MRGGKHDGKGRIAALLVLCVLVFGAFTVRLVWLQFVQGDHYREKVAQASTTSYRVTVPAARGDLLDRNGTVLAQDLPVYDLSLVLPAPPGTTTEQALETLRELQILDPNAGGKDVETQLAAFFAAARAGELPLASALSPSQAAVLYQSGLPQSGAVRLTARGKRSWPDGTLAPHWLGGTGAITAEQWAADDHALRRAGVAMNATIGQSGLEAVYDPVLRGRDGIVRVSAQDDGSRIEQPIQPPQPGANVELYLDAGLQRTARQALYDQLHTLQTTKEPGKGREACAGAAVVVEIATGGILAAASVPDFDRVTYPQQYAALAADPAAPLFDRTCQGQYAPGSAFKPAVAVAALSAGISPTETVRCDGVYRHYAGYQPRCLQLSHGGAVSLRTALQHSCNIYFYEMGRRLGVDAFSATAQQLGLGAETGLELPQAAGRLTFSSDENFQAGLTLQAAIGQGNTAVTPVQLASYAAALAQNGTRPALQAARRVVAQDGTVLWQHTPTAAATLPGGEAVFGPVREGMIAMAQTLHVLREAPLPLACKTGSPQLPQRLPNGLYLTHSVLIGYAPADAPQIAVAVVLERGGGGANAAPVLRAIVDAWAQHGPL